MNAKQLRLTPTDIRHNCTQEEFPFKGTEELGAVEDMIGQQRAIDSLSFAIEMGARGYNVYVTGPEGVGKQTMVRKMIEKEARQGAVPPDWVYVYNFDDPRRPRCLQLPAGSAIKFKKDLEQLLEEIRQSMSRALKSDLYEQEKKRIMQQLQQSRSQMLNQLQQEAREKGFALQQSSSGLVLYPLKDNGEPMEPEEFAQLSEDDRKRLEQDRHHLQERLEDTMQELQKGEREMRKAFKQLQHETARNATDHLINELQQTYCEQEKICHYLKQLSEDILRNIQYFTSDDEEEAPANPIPGMPGSDRKDFAAIAHKYEANVLVDNSEQEGTPVITDNNPTYRNLFGRVERQAQMGALVTNFTMIKAGTLHQANGGYLILKAEYLLRNPFVWEGLKRTLREGSLRITDPSEEYGFFSTQNLEPEPVPIDAKIILIGSPMLHHLLYSLDEEFRELFKVRADFALHVERDHHHIEKYGQFVHTYCDENGLLQFDSSGLSRLIEYASELVADQHKLSTRFGILGEIVEQADYWCRKRSGEQITAKDVNQALDKRIYRSNHVEELVQQAISEGTIFIETEGEAVGQVNGLSVSALGDHSFGRPSRITARTFVGRQGLVNVEREVELSGKIHDKAVLVISGYLSGKYGQDQPLSLAASITFEQLYDQVDGDSASCAEVYALLSSLSEIPLKQGIAVTGSINQLGRVQPVGGVKEKIEGFFLTCKHQGLTGEQGVIVPRANVRHLMLSEEVVEAVAAEQFHIYAIEDVEEGLEILTDRTAGELDSERQYPADSVNALVQQKLAHYWGIWQRSSTDKDKEQA